MTLTLRNPQTKIILIACGNHWTSTIYFTAKKLIHKTLQGLECILWFLDFLMTETKDQKIKDLKAVCL